MPEFINSNSLNLKTSIRWVLLVSTVAVGISTKTMANAQVFRYEEGGKVTYGDYIPKSGLETGHSVLSSQGVVLKQVKSREERREARRLEKEAQVLRLRDRTLLKTFTEEEDLIRTRDERLGLLDDQINRLDDRVRISKEILVSIDQRIRTAGKLKGASKAISDLRIEMSRTNKKIENTWSQIDFKAAERNTIAAKFEADIIRYRWLKSGGGYKY